MELQFASRRYYTVKRNQTVKIIGEAFGVLPRAIIKENALECEVEEGEILVIPRERYSLYTVQGGESKTLLCGSPELFEKKNDTRCFYIGQRVAL